MENVTREPFLARVPITNWQTLTTARTLTFSEVFEAEM